jgi:L-aminopeptidase/D-esterase-like protein
MGLGIARSGAVSGHSSGDIFMAFSTANETAFQNENKLACAQFIPNSQLDQIFEAVIQSVDEAVLNALFANETMEGFNGSRIEALPQDEVIEIMRKYNALQ